MPDAHQFFTRQHEQLNNIETRMVKSQNAFAAARTEALDSLKAKREQAAASREAFQAKLAVPINQMKASAAARKEQTSAAIEEWKRKREVKKLEDRAADLEAYAEAATAVLNLAQEEAHQASIDAIEARRVADEARSVPA